MDLGNASMKVMNMRSCQVILDYGGISWQQ